MLIFQGLVGFELWFGQQNFDKKNIEELKNLLLS
jgi:shikimate 5-dehydrogenase